MDPPDSHVGHSWTPQRVPVAVESAWVIVTSTPLSLLKFPDTLLPVNTSSPADDNGVKCGGISI